jgi:adenylate cyclase
MQEDDVTSAEARDALARVLDSPEFAPAARLRDFLRYVVTEAIAGRGGAIKGYAIAVDVFGRPADFDQATDPIVRVEASRLRRALAQYYQGSGATDPVVVELPRGGYVPAFRRRAGLEALLPEPAAEPALELDHVVPGEGPSPAVFVPTRGVVGFRIAVLTGILLSLAALGYLVWNAAFSDRDPGSARAPVTSGMARPIIAVAALENLTGTAEDAVFARGLATELVAELARFRDFVVYALDAGDMPTAGYILAGNLRHAGNDVRVTMQLIDAATRQTVWSETYERSFDLASMLAIQDEIARDVAIAVAQPYGAIYEREIVAAGARPQTMEGYTCVLRVYEYWRTLAPEDHKIVRDCLERTLVADPGYAAAWQAVTYIYLDEYRYNFNVRKGDRDPRERAFEAAQRGVSLSPTDALSYQSLYAAYYYRGDMEGFRRAGAEALRLNPNNPDIVADYGSKAAVAGDWDEGLKLVRRAMTLNPAHPGWYYTPLVLDAYRRGDYADALANAERMNMPEHYRVWVFFAMIYGQLGDRMQARAALENLARLDPDFGLNARADMAKWGYAPDLTEACIGGLRKAGLDLGD